MSRSSRCLVSVGFLISVLCISHFPDAWMEEPIVHIGGGGGQTRDSKSRRMILSLWLEEFSDVMCRSFGKFPVTRKCWMTWFCRQSLSDKCGTNTVGRRAGRCSKASSVSTIVQLLLGASQDSCQQNTIHIHELRDFIGSVVFIG
jgi:hypothetical protein